MHTIQTLNAQTFAGWTDGLKIVIDAKCISFDQLNKQPDMHIAAPDFDTARDIIDTLPYHAGTIYLSVPNDWVERLTSLRSEFEYRVLVVLPPAHDPTSHLM